MAIVFDAVLGSPTANSYITAARADDLMPLLVSSTRLNTWSALDNSAKQNYLMRAVKMIEMYIEFEGIRLVYNQPIAWPRDLVYGPDRSYDHIAYPTNDIPDQVEEAQALMALNLAEGFDQTDSASSPVDYVKISSISVSFSSERAARSSSLLPNEVIEKLYGFGEYVGASGMAKSIDMVRA